MAHGLQMGIQMGAQIDERCPKVPKRGPETSQKSPGEASGPKRASLVPTHYLPYRTHTGGSRRYPFQHFSLARSPSKRQAEKYVTKGGATGAQGTPRRRQGEAQGSQKDPKKVTQNHQKSTPGAHGEKSVALGVPRAPRRIF